MFSMQVAWTATEMQHRVKAVHLALTHIFAHGSVAHVGDNSVAFTYFCRGKERDVKSHIRVIERNHDIVRCILMNFYHCKVASKYRM